MAATKPHDGNSSAGTPRIGAGVQATSLVELRASVRFPMRLPIKVRAGRGTEVAETVNVSASGVLFTFSRSLDAGSIIEVEMTMPAQTLGTPQDVVVQCQGRVVRSYPKGPSRVEVATVIDEYQMLS